ncbi:MAG: hypothetical protein ACR2P1_22020 [Pseudomonadales bacterium]
MSTSEANRCEKIAAIPVEKFEAVIAHAKETGQPVTSSYFERAAQQAVNKESHDELRKAAE